MGHLLVSNLDVQHLIAFLGVKNKSKKRERMYPPGRMAGMEVSRGSLETWSQVFAAAVI